MDDQTFQNQTQTQLMKYAEDIRKLYQELKKENLRLKKTQHELEEHYYETVLMGFDLINLYDEFLGGHCRRVANYAGMVAKVMKLERSSQNEIKIAALLHDIELIGTSRAEILKWYFRKRDAIPESFAQHPIVNIRPIISSRRYQNVAKYIAAHHENMDGTGYPKGLKEKQIPMESRIISVVDRYDLIRHRHKKPEEPEICLQKMHDEYSDALDPEVLAIFEDLISENDPYAQSMIIRPLELKPGMILATPIVTRDGRIMITPDTILSDKYIERIQTFANLNRLRLPFKVYRPESHGKARP